MRVKISEIWLLTMLALLFGVIGFLVTHVPVKVVTVFGAIVTVGFLFKHFTGKMAGFIALSLIFFLIPAAGFTSLEYLIKTGRSNFLNEFVEDTLKNWEFSVLSKGRYYSFDTSVDRPKNLELVIDVEGKAIVSFIEGVEIKYPKVLKIEKIGNKVKIRGGDKKSTYILQIGNSGIDAVNLSAISLEISGKLNTTKSHFSAVSLKLNGNFEASEIDVDGTGVEMNGEFSSDKIVLDGVGITLKGLYVVNDFKISGVGINLNLNLSNCENFEISATGVNGSIAYSGGKALNLNVNGVGGNLKFKNLSQETVSIQSSGVKVVRE